MKTGSFVSSWMQETLCKVKSIFWGSVICDEVSLTSNLRVLGQGFHGNHVCHGSVSYIGKRSNGRLSVKSHKGASEFFGSSKDGCHVVDVLFTVQYHRSESNCMKRQTIVYNIKGNLL